jgi:hypothetical protein
MTSGLQEAVGRLFDDPSVAYGASGLERPGEGEAGRSEAGRIGGQ